MEHIHQLLVQTPLNTWYGIKKSARINQRKRRRAGRTATSGARSTPRSTFGEAVLAEWARVRGASLAALGGAALTAAGLALAAGWGRLSWVRGVGVGLADSLALAFRCGWVPDIRRFKALP